MFGAFAHGNWDSVEVEIGDPLAEDFGDGVLGLVGVNRDSHDDGS